MAGFIDRGLAALGLPTRDEVASLRSEIESLEKRVRMRPTSSGVDITYGNFGVEYLRELSWDKRWDVYDRMESDPMVKEGLDGYVLPLITGSWEVAAASDKPIDKEIAEFVSANLLRTTGDQYGRDYWTQTSWKGQRLPEILDFLKCGFAMFNKSTRFVEGKVVFDRLQWLEPRSVDPHGWKLSATDELEHVKRTYRDPIEQYKLQEPILAKQLALYVWDLKGARLEGRAKIRSVYGAHSRKDFMLRIQAVWAQKVGAPIPVAHVPSTIYQKHKAEIEQLVQAMRGEAPAEAYAVLPMNSDGTKVELGYAGLSGEGTAQVDRMRGVIGTENSEIAHGMNSKSRLLGETNAGARALGETQSADEDLGVQATAEIICEIENHGIANLPGLVQQLVDWNFAGVKRYPELRCSRIGVEDFKTLGPLSSATKAGLVPVTPELRRQVTEKFGIKLPDEAYEIVELGEDEELGPGWKRGKQPPSKKYADKEKSERQLAIRLAIGDMLRWPAEAHDTARAKGLGRSPSVFESKVCALGVVADVLRTGGDHLASGLKRGQAAMIEDLLGRLGSGAVSRRTLGTLRQSRPKGYGDLCAAVRERFLEVASTGRRHVKDEIARQTYLAEAVSRGEVAAYSVMLETNDGFPEDETPRLLPPGSEIPIGGAAADAIAELVRRGRIVSTLTQELNGEARVATQIAVDEIWHRLLEEAIWEFNAGIREGLSEADALKRVESALSGLSPARTDLAGRQLAEVAYNQGRDFAAKEAAAAGVAEWAIRSEVLDSRTCSVCAHLDGTIVQIGSPEYERLMPPARCEGGENCRGFYVVVTRELAEQLRKRDAA